MQWQQRSRLHALWTCLRPYGHYSAVLLLALALVACSDHDRDDFFAGDRLRETPPGGANFGVLQPFDITAHQGTIVDEDDANGYELTLSEDSLLILSVESLERLNAFVEIYDAEGFFLLADDNGGIGSDALIVNNFEAGDYTVLVWSSTDGPTSGDYELNVLVGSEGTDLEILDPGAVVPVNNVFLPAGAVGQSYVFTLSEAASVDFEVQQDSGAADLALQLIDQRGAEVFFNDPPGLEAPVVSGSVLDQGTYLLIVSNEAQAEEGIYDLRVTVQP